MQYMEKTVTFKLTLISILKNNPFYALGQSLSFFGPRDEEKIPAQFSLRCCCTLRSSEMLLSVSWYIVTAIRKIVTLLSSWSSCLLGSLKVFWDVYTVLMDLLTLK
jgi:hypothetical protein